jgi:putative transcriptional regulator
MSDDGTMKKATKHDWSRLDAMSKAAKHAAALSDPDAQPLTQARMKHMRRTPQVRVIRRALGLSQAEFAARFRVPLGALRDWEQGRKEPDSTARTYLMVIARNAAAVDEALHPTASAPRTGSKPPSSHRRRCLLVIRLRG